jgi:hypothetical protein
MSSSGYYCILGHNAISAVDVDTCFGDTYGFHLQCREVITLAWYNEFMWHPDASCVSFCLQWKQRWGVVTKLSPAAGREQHCWVLHVMTLCKNQICDPQVTIGTNSLTLTRCMNMLCSMPSQSHQVFFCIVSILCIFRIFWCVCVKCVLYEVYSLLLNIYV